MIRLHNIQLSFSSQQLYNDLMGTFAQHDRVGLVGRNGSGKSTLLKVIAGLQPIDAGQISIPHQYTIAYLPQEVILESSRSVIDETLTTYREYAALLTEKSMLESQLDTEHNETVLERYATICAELAELDGPSKQAEAKRVLMGLGFKEQHLDQPVTTLSGGWKMRIVLAKLLLARADFYLFDEPTNHLDIVAKDWFVSFLSQAPFGFIMVSHERYMLNKMCDKIMEIELGTATMYHGNFAHYEERKAQKMQELLIAYEQQQREIKAKIATVERFKAKASKAGMAKSMLKKIEKIEKIEIPPSPPSVAFPPLRVERSARNVLNVQQVAHSFDENTIFHAVTAEIERGEKVALVAANGVGKTTLFNLIVGKLALQQGSIEFGDKVKTALFEQEQDTWLDRSLSIVDNIRDHCPSAPEQKIRALLGTFLFSGDEVNKKTGVLSGGEKSRVGMVRLLLQDANFLLLDEPTNHLDIPSKDILVKALQAHEGTLLFVSHDHDFINKLATRIIELRPDGATSYPGNYDDYLYALNQRQLPTQHTVPSTTSVPISKPKAHQQSTQHQDTRKKASALERKIEKLEREQQALERQFALLTYGTPEFNEAQQRLQRIIDELEACYAQWEAFL